MSGIYLHIPFCKQACHYCDFHFSTTQKHRAEVLAAMCLELEQRAGEAHGQEIQTVYFGGGTPSLLTPEEIKVFLETIHRFYSVAPGAEVTLEANPDDLDLQRIESLAAGPVNRLSIGIQSFREKELQWMNRAHTTPQAVACLEAVRSRFENYSIDLIYGLPGSTPGQWKETLEKALGFEPPHISAYALTVEPGTALGAMVAKGRSPDVDDTRAEEDFRHLADTLEGAGYVHYETSNFGKPGFFSRNNTAYWQGKAYLGIGPSAHSYDGKNRRWNVAHNLKYLKALQEGTPYWESEALSVRDRYNEAIMTGLRTVWGVSLSGISQAFGPAYLDYLLGQAQPYLDSHLLFRDGDALFTSRKGKFLADGIASDLFMVNLK
ncbi:radical SAM family heme chaperone HemW [Robiginitalea sp. M366]|uniref:radical SAM family heme chaperone HemW n=1 Tax=Robiginitalea aestuariiviva TaxID=3036903 RepID=UPI00240DF033|nr:radical SAM family heme chaperone HemW [Robiginitalea aestuariiviva]MDG1571097.1 radical SAM family heme chaperone HemW [Robiginitalea aestuariiviva]